MALLALVAGQDVEPAEGSDGTDGRWRIARQVAPDRVISTVDPEARHAHKTRSRRQDGYKAHIVVEPDTGIITDTALTPAAGPDNSDAAVGIDLLLADTEHRPVTGAVGAVGWEVLGDSAYGTGDALAALQPTPGTPRSSSRGRCARRSRAGSPSTTSPSSSPPPTSPDGDLPERGHPADHPDPQRRPSAPRAAAARCAPGAPPPRPAAR